MTLLDILQAAGYALDTPGALLRGAISGKPGSRASGREMLEALGLVGPNDTSRWDAGDVAGIAADLALDPLNLIGAGLLGKTAKAASAAKQSNKASDLMRAMGFMPEEIAKQTKVIGPDGLPKRMYHGTDHVFEDYDMAKMDPASLFGPGIYTTDNPQVASTYTYKSNQPAVIDERYLEPGWERPNVRMQYIDARNPLRIDSSVVVPEVAKANMRRQQRNFVRQRVGDLRLERSRLIGGEVFGYLDQGILQANAKVAENTIRDLFSRRNQIPDTLPGEMLYEGLRSEGVRQAGYDSIQHTGGTRMGGGKTIHDVWIALDPSQVYKPYIAPAYQPVPSVAPQAAAMAGYNALRPFGRQPRRPPLFEGINL